MQMRKENNYVSRDGVCTAGKAYTVPEPTIKGGRRRRN